IAAGQRVDAHERAGLIEWLAIENVTPAQGHRFLHFAGDLQAPLLDVEIPRDIERGVHIVDDVELIVRREVDGLARRDREHASEDTADRIASGEPGERTEARELEDT